VTAAESLVLILALVLMSAVAFVPSLPTRTGALLTTIRLADLKPDQAAWLTSVMAEAEAAVVKPGDPRLQEVIGR
jgi:hypothetical protein